MSQKLLQGLVSHELTEICNCNLNDLGISLPFFLFRTNLKLQNISVTPKLVKKVTINLDVSKTSGFDSIPVVVLKSCEPELSYTLAELFNLSETIFFSGLLEGLISGSCN